MRKSNYDKAPSTAVDGCITVGWNEITGKLAAEYASCQVWAVETYTGVHEDEVASALAATGRTVVNTRSLMVSEDEVERMTRRFMTDDPLFGYISNISLDEYFSPEKCRELTFNAGEQYVVLGTGAAKFVPEGSPVIYLDMPRWELQLRFRRHEVKALGIDNSHDAPSVQYKRGYFNDWNILDRYKLSLCQEGRISYWIDTTIADQPKMIANDTFMQGIRLTASGPFRVVPFFDPAPWGGQWMKEVCDLDRSAVNYGWCFDCVPEENSLFFSVSGTLFELPAQDLVMLQTRPLLGEEVEARFGKSFPIRFDFLDTMGGGNLSLQVHPTNQFAHDNFGLLYTQDESYYLMDAEPGATVYLGLRKGVDGKAMIADLRKAQREGTAFDAERYVNRLPAHKHDHFLIPGGTIHCSGAGAMVLEISSTPSIFTFKLYDWQRLGLDGKPRPINIERGSHVIDWGRDTDYVEARLHNHFETLATTPTYTEERTGLHPNEFIETRRHTFTGPVVHDTAGSVNVLNLVDGDEAVVKSPTGAFPPFVVHYAETFILPACVGKYTIEPYGASKGKPCKTIKASVRINSNCQQK